MARGGVLAPTRTDFYYRWQRARCYLCAGTMHKRSKPTHPRGVTHDHVVPRHHGGTREDNIALACRGCNGARGCKKPTACMVMFARLAAEAYDLCDEYFHQIYIATPRAVQKQTDRLFAGTKKLVSYGVASMISPLPLWSHPW